jgi:hypothetical protein
MRIAPTKVCPICGETIRNLDWKKHYEGHSEAEKQGLKNPSIPDNASADIKELMKSAMAAQEKMLAAPDVFLGEDSSDQHEALKRVHCPEALGENAEWEAVFGDASKRLDGYTARAYFPVLDDKGNIVRDDGGHPLLKLRKEIYSARKAVPQAESRRRISAVTQEASKRSTVSNEQAPGGVRYFEDELTITKNNGG